jgi:triosephosphate isomerase (TIM)
MSRQQIAAANWKMNLTLSEAEALATQVSQNATNLKANQQIVFGVPFTYLQSIQGIISGTPQVFIAAQNCSNMPSGAYTGETSVAQLQQVGVTHVIIGHSERREYFNETNQFLAEKVNICLANNLKPIFCCGEPLAIREAETQNSYVQQQLSESLFHLTPQQITNFIIAYEPIWAIGTGKTATNQQAQDMHAHIRNVLQSQYGADIAATISILYGGSVKAANAHEIFAQPDVDGGLVGGASLIATEFGSIVNTLK